MYMVANYTFFLYITIHVATPYYMICADTYINQLIMLFLLYNTFGTRAIIVHTYAIVVIHACIY